MRAKIINILGNDLLLEWIPLGAGIPHDDHLSVYWEILGALVGTCIRMEMVSLQMYPFVERQGHLYQSFP